MFFPGLDVLPIRWCSPRTEHTDRGREPPNLLNLPLEIRHEIFSYLLSKETISDRSNKHGWMTHVSGWRYVDKSWRASFKRWRNPNDPWLGVLPNDRDYFTSSKFAIFLINRQLASEAVSYLYPTSTVKITISRRGIDFLKSFSDNHITGLLYPPFDRHRKDVAYNLPHSFPYHALKECVIEIQLLYGADPDLLEEVRAIRHILHRLCAYILKHKIHFRKLRVRFSVADPVEASDGWDTLWDSDTPGQMEQGSYEGQVEEEFCVPDHSVYNQQGGVRVAQDCPSTFAWFISVFAVCPGIADECVIELPISLQDKPHMQQLAQWYAEGVDGRCPFSEEEEWCLVGDRYNLDHLEDWCWDDSCTHPWCVEYKRGESERERENAEHDLVVRRLDHAYDLQNAFIPPGTELWEISDGYDLEFWEKVRKRIMDAMKAVLGRRWGRKLYHLCFWPVWGFKRDHLKEEIDGWENFLGDEVVSRRITESVQRAEESGDWE
ncbi:MAG: hypothetical protein Q9171_007255, partial [Xanthocarpia ochracea]